MRVTTVTSPNFPNQLATMVVSAVLLLLSPDTKAQSPVVAGIDHVGINVPDLDQAVRFFHETFGFEPVTKLGPFSMDKNWKEKFHIHDGAGEVTLIMMRAGDGSNIEIFGYKPGAGSTEQPFRDDIGATHIALYTADIEETRKLLESKGIKFLTDINSGGGDTEGEKWVYFETPWGSTIELNTYPNGKGYEKQHPAVKLWTPASAIQLTMESMSKAALQEFAAKQVQVWNDTDPADRLIKMKAIYDPQVAFYDEESSVNGLTNLNERITALQQKNVHFKFSLIKIDNCNNMVRYYWNYGPATQPKLIAGMDLIILKEGKIRSLNVFFDHLPAQAKK